MGGFSSIASSSHKVSWTSTHSLKAASRRASSPVSRIIPFRYVSMRYLTARDIMLSNIYWTTEISP
ncbi:MAG: hypothetical protein QG666_225 [Euryarchaeota archaeon]|nr:hypothetical protein [Euryarchaeota archaeon]MDQ1311941.1 hypothetical protein [Euryarchaeota archaeon]